MSIANNIEAKVKGSLSLDYFDLQNESHLHAGPATESHFKLTAVSDDFSAMSLVKRHQLLYKCLREELQGPVHALALHLYTVAEWAQNNTQSPVSPACAGKNK